MAETIFYVRTVSAEIRRLRGATMSLMGGPEARGNRRPRFSRRKMPIEGGHHVFEGGQGAPERRRQRHGGEGSDMEAKDGGKRTRTGDEERGRKEDGVN